MARKQVSIARRRALVARCEASGQALHAFARAHGIPYSTFYRWSRRYGQGARQHTAKTSSVDIQMVEVQVVDAPKVSPPSQSLSLELALPGGSQLRFQQGVEPTYIAALIAAVGDVVRC